MADTSSNQGHGIRFERRIIEESGRFADAATTRQRSPTARFDIDAEDDLKLNIPTSIKVSKGKTVPLSDARRIWQSFRFAPYRMIVGVYRQVEGEKIFGEVHEIILRDEYREALLGSVSEEEISDFHEGLKSFWQVGRDSQVKASAWAQQRKLELKSQLGHIQLNPKADSKGQRRLQCSVYLSPLINILNEDDYTHHSDSFGSLDLPFGIDSGTRRFRDY